MRGVGPELIEANPLPSSCGRMEHAQFRSELESLLKKCSILQYLSHDLSFWFVATWGKISDQNKVSTNFRVLTSVFVHQKRLIFDCLLRKTRPFGYCFRVFPLETLPQGTKQ